MLLKTIHRLLGTWDGICFRLIEDSGIFFKNRAIRKFGLTIQIHKDCRRQKMGEHSMFDEDSLKFYDLDKDVGVGIINAIRTVHDKLSCTARFHIKRLKRRRKTSRSPPFRKVLLFRPSFKHKIAWCIKYAGDYNLSFTYFRCDIISRVVLLHFHPFLNSKGHNLENGSIDAII